VPPALEQEVNRTGDSPRQMRMSSAVLFIVWSSKHLAFAPPQKISLPKAKQTEDHGLFHHEWGIHDINAGTNLLAGRILSSLIRLKLIKLI